MGTPFRLETGPAADLCFFSIHFHVCRSQWSDGYDQGIDYAEQTRNHALINRAHSINPNKYKGYGEKHGG
jgi:hypothetical protein